MKRVPVLIVLGALALGANVAHAQPKSLDVPLRWAPMPKGNQRPPTLDATGGLCTVRLEPVVDKRDKRNQVGENLDKSQAVPIYTNSNVGTFLDDVLKGEMRGLGLELVADNAERVVKTELIELWVRDSSGYRCVVRTKTTVTDADGEEIWSGLVGGVGERSGHSLRVPYYQEAISNAILDLVYSLAKEPKFVAALKKDEM